MKKLALIVLIAASMFSTVLAAEKKNEKTITYKVSIDCHNCVKKIEGNIAYEKGVKDLKVSLDKKECTITYRVDKTSPEKLIEAFGKLGYKAEIKPEEKPDKTDKSVKDNAVEKTHEHK